jgi:hypothetical protein
MANLKLPKLRERSPVRLTIAISPDLHQAMLDYAEIYAATYGKKETIADLIPSILEHFIASDRDFLRSRSAMSKPNE